MISVRKAVEIGANAHQPADAERPGPGNRYGSFSRVNASAGWMFSPRWGIFTRIENLLHRRDLGFDRTVIHPHRSAVRIAGTQRDPGLVISAGFQVQF